MEMTYEAEFLHPLFDLPSHNIELLKSFYQSIHPQFPLRTTDLHVFGGSALSDVCVRVAMLGGHGTIEMTAERLSIRINGITDEQELATCNRCIMLATQALKGTLPDVVTKTVAARTTRSLSLGDGSMTASDFLQQTVTPGIDMKLTDLGNAVQSPCVNIEVQNNDEDWRAVLHAHTNAIERSSVIVSCWTAVSVRPFGDG